MKKSFAIAGTAIIAGVLAMQPIAANAACANYAIWTQDGESGEVKKWSTDGTLLDTLQTDIDASDIAVSSDLTEILAFDGSDLKGYSTSTGALESTNPVTGSFSGGGAGAGVISGGKILTDGPGAGDSAGIVSVDLTTYAATSWADLEDADASVPVGVRGGGWSVAGDILQLPDNDILVVAENLTAYLDGVVLLRIDKNDPTSITAVGVVPVSDDAVWGAARAGDDMFLATASGRLLKLASVPTTASLNPVSTTEIVTGGGTFWGAAGSDDSTEGNASCELAETGADQGPLGLAAAALISAGAAALMIRRRTARS